MDIHVIKVHAIDSQKCGSYQHVRHSGRDNRHRTALRLGLLFLCSILAFCFSRLFLLCSKEFTREGFSSKGLGRF